MNERLFKNTSVLSKLILRRDRLRFILWILGISVLTIATAVAFPDLYRTATERQQLAETMVNPAMTAMVGQGYGLDNYTYGAMMAHQMLGMTALLVGLMNVLLVTRHTRLDEEDGRTEMIGALPVGRLSPLASSLTVMLGVNFSLALMIGWGLYATGIESLDLNGSLLYGSAIGSIGLFFAGTTALFAQLSDNSRGTVGFSIALLGIAYLIRAIGDVSNETLSWLSPFGWILGSEAYVNNYWWPIILTLGVAIALVGIALYLNVIRDLGGGFLPSKPGRSNASPFLQSPLGLAFRLQRTGFIAWVAGVFVMAASYGSVLGDTDTLIADVEMMMEFMEPVEGAALTDQFITMLMVVMAILASIPTLMMILKLKGEEKNHRTEHVYSLAVSRQKLLASYLSVSIFTSIVMLVASAIGMGSIGVVVIESDITLGTFFSSSLVYLPALWMMTSFAVLLIGWAPKYTGLTWLYLGFSFVVVYLGGLFQFPDWISSLTPFSHVPDLPVEEVNLFTLIIMTVIAIFITALGFVGYGRRDIQG
ncbi:ABC transporter permease [Salipaludibacillus keqinensis]|uniref:ABC transporter permease n=1 Tax=Salipaludibacillus keqinensis TaxID=2045207 RepID=A0A323TRJ0_9BACI|nr:ABC transporter permease [Salipaludibacillus keqinensis]PYZ91975.1 ABC transporter permease [Salipaludibacillus keqinensis]